MPRIKNLPKPSLAVSTPNPYPARVQLLPDSRLQPHGRFRKALSPFAGLLPRKSRHDSPCFSPDRQPPIQLLIVAFAFAIIAGFTASAAPFTPGLDPANDWLVSSRSSDKWPAKIAQAPTGKDITLQNGLIARRFRIAPNAATVGLDNLATGTSLLRAVKPEATLEVNGVEIKIGGLQGQRDHAFLLSEWVDDLKPVPGSMRMESFTTGRTAAPFQWAKKRHAQPSPWPAPGVSLNLNFKPSDTLPLPDAPKLDVTVHYEMYDGMPVLSKWLTVTNRGEKPVRLDRATVEILAAVEAESAVDTRPTNKWRLPNISVLSDYSFGGMDPVTSSRVTEWVPDPEFLTQVHYSRLTPALLLCRPPVGPGVELAPGASWTSFRVWLVVHDDDSRERQGLGLRKAQRALAPWSTENPLMMHVRNADRKSFRTAVDQCAEVGFEMIIYTFGSGLEMENDKPEYMASVKEDVDYAHAKGIEVGAYSLLSSRRIDDINDVINPTTGKPGGAIFGNAPCLGSRWATNYFRKLTQFIETTGLDLLEHDGPYPGDVCASTSHPGHHGVQDSQWTQWETSANFYRWCRERGTYVNAPDYYFFTGTSKTGMGYREENWSLPRALQILHGRQNIYDGTFEKTPTMGWMFVPLTEYQGGGPAATIEPLRDHLPDYEAHLANNLGAGVQACYRGPRLYDSEETKVALKKWVTWFKAHRDILEGDIVHLRRADGRDIDYFLHVNPAAPTPGMAMIYNPLPHEVERTLRFPLYYTGLQGAVRASVNDAPAKRIKLDAQYGAEVPLRIPASGRAWVTFARP